MPLDQRLFATNWAESYFIVPKLFSVLVTPPNALFGLASSKRESVGFVKRNWLERQLGPRAFELHMAVKRAFDPQNLLNPGKKA